MNRLRTIFTIIACIACCTLSAGNVPESVKDSLKSLYPNLENIGWSNDNDYYVASFQHNGFGTKVWFNEKGQWVMKQTDWQVMDEVPMPVYHTFTFGPYSSDQINDVTYVEFPQKSPLIVLLIQQPDIETEYQLFYTPEGELVNARNVTYINNPLGASTFL